MSKRYEGTVYIGVVGPDDIPVQAALSIVNIRRQDGDRIPQFRMGTKGFEVRQQHIDFFMDETEHDFILLLDHDMIFEPDTLERLRSHGEPYVSGFYMRRRWGPIMPVWFEPFNGEWPHRPWTTVPERGRLHELGASGWGCVLLHREVIESTRETVLKGERDVMEDDMDVWPYDLGAVLRGEEEMRPLRYSKDNVGSDIRYPFYARAAGWTLYGDPDVRPKHILDYPLSADDFEQMPEGALEELAQRAEGMIVEHAAVLAAAREVVTV